MEQRLRRRALTCFVVALCACSRVPTCPQPACGSTSEKFLKYTRSNLQIIPGEYLVVFDSALVPATSVPTLSASLIAGTAGTVTYVFRKSLRGFAAQHLDDAWANVISQRSDVSFVRKNFLVFGADLRGGAFKPVPWNLDRIDQRARFGIDRDYRFKTGPVNSNPIPIYVLDNGIYGAHEEFAGLTGSRVTNVADVRGTNFARCALSAADANHGTRAASIAAGVHFGITATVIMNVKVLYEGLFNTCIAGSPTDVLAGLDATNQHMTDNNITKAIVNLSVGWTGNTPDVVTAIGSLQARGALVVAAAGNENQDAAGTTPANVLNVLAVGATTESDARLVFSSTKGSNFGATVALWAPGYSIKAADWPAAADPTAVSVASGTSDAAPHVAGAAALFWQQNPTMNANQVATALKSDATLHMLSNLGAGSTNALLYIGEPAPMIAATKQINHGSNGGDLTAVRVANDRTRVYGTGAVTGPYAYASYDAANVNAAGAWQANPATVPAGLDCFDIHASSASVGSGIGGEPVYFGCEGIHNGTREAVVIATQQNNVSIWPQPAWLGTSSRMGGVTDDYTSPSLRVFAITTRSKAPPAIGSEVVVTSIDGGNGQVLKSVVLTAPSFSEQFHRAVDLVLIDTALDTIGGLTSTDLVAATSSDPPGADKTFLWKLDPNTLQVIDSREVPPPPLAKNGMFATALAAQSLEDNGNGISIRGEVFLATGISVEVQPGHPQSGHVPWSYVYRLSADRMTASAIEVVKEGLVVSLWSEEGDLFFGGTMKNGLPAGSEVAFLGKSEGVFNSRRWITTFDAPGFGPNSGHVGYGTKKAYLVGRNSSSSYIVEYQVY